MFQKQFVSTSRKPSTPQALQVIEDYVRLCGPNGLGCALEAELLFQKKLFHLALEAARRSLKLSGTNPRMHELIGLVCIMDHQNGGAVTELKRAQEEDPNSPQIRYYYGRVLYTVGRYQKAADQFLACLKLRPNYPGALGNLGPCYEALQNYPKAIETYRDLQGRHPLRKGETGT
jgi:tetratricopeptide (TPR) repeat protein